MNQTEEKGAEATQSLEEMNPPFLTEMGQQSLTDLCVSLAGQQSISKPNSFPKSLSYSNIFPAIPPLAGTCMVSSLSKTDAVPSWEHKEVNCDH